MLFFVYYKTRKNTLRHYLCESSKEMWDAIHKVLDKGYTVTEINAYYGPGHKVDYTLHFDLQGEPQLREFRSRF